MQLAQQPVLVRCLPRAKTSNLLLRCRWQPQMLSNRITSSRRSSRCSLLHHNCSIRILDNCKRMKILTFRRMSNLPQCMDSQFRISKTLLCLHKPVRATTIAVTMQTSTTCSKSELSTSCKMKLTKICLKLCKTMDRYRRRC